MELTSFFTMLVSLALAIYEPVLKSAFNFFLTLTHYTS
jgi:hypothetical protein